MATPTYTLIDSTTLSVDTGFISFSNLPQNYRDLVVVGQGTFDNNMLVQFSTNTGSYSGVRGYSYIAPPYSDTMPNNTYWWTPVGTGRPDFQFTLQLFDYAQTDKHKVALCRANNDSSTGMAAYRSASTTAINYLLIRGNSSPTYNFEAGSTFFIYGIEA